MIVIAKDKKSLLKSYQKKPKKHGYKKITPFYDWCYNNLPKDEADKIIERWDYSLNVDKEGNILTPKDVSHGSNGINKKGYWFKCLDHPEHGSELKRINDFTSGQKGSILCSQCNTIAYTHPHLIKYLVNKEDAYKYTYGSGKKIPMKCPDCGFKKKISINNLIYQNFSCPKCNDKIPYSEKFMFSVLEQILDNDFKTQLSKTTLKWCGKYKYDFYIPIINGICEVNGEQHYIENNKSKWKISLSEIQENDFDKEWLARENNIQNYIILDCRYSDMEWIKNSIMSSRLPNLLNFKEDDIDWLKCHEAGCKSLVKEATKLWNDGIKNALSISKILKLNRNTISRYLKQGTKLGWCNYDPKIEQKKALITMQKIIQKSVICLTTKNIFNSIADAERKYNIHSVSIINCCNNKQKYAGKLLDGTKLTWMYYEDYILKNDEEIMHKINYSKIKNHTCQKQIMCLTTGEIFNSIIEATNKYNISTGNISKCCSGKKKSAGKLPNGTKLVWIYYNKN